MVLDCFNLLGGPTSHDSSSSTVDSNIAHNLLHFLCFFLRRELLTRSVGHANTFHTKFNWQILPLLSIHPKVLGIVPFLCYNQVKRIIQPCRLRWRDLKRVDVAGVAVKDQTSACVRGFRFAASAAKRKADRLDKMLISRIRKWYARATDVTGDDWGSQFCKALT